MTLQKKNNTLAKHVATVWICVFVFAVVKMYSLYKIRSFIQTNLIYSENTLNRTEKIAISEWNCWNEFVYA